jgi:hypothetical protein
MKNLTEHYIKQWVIPFYHSRIIDWENKREKLLQVYERFSKPLMNGTEQLTDFNSGETRYDMLIQNILFDDLRIGVKELGFDKTPTVKNSWFQIYNISHSHAVHNHGMGALSVVCYIKYNSAYHRPTTFIAPYHSLDDGNVLEYEPDDVEEGSIIIFPSSLAHYVPTNQSTVERMVLACNIN